MRRHASPLWLNGMTMVLIGFAVIERLKGVKTNTVGLTAEESEVAIFRQGKEKPSDSFKRFEPQFNVKDQVLLVRQSTEAARSPQAVPTEAKEMLRSVPKPETDSASLSPDIVRLAAEKSLLMDDLLNEEPIPSDYGQVMVGLFRDRGQDVYTRDFAVQHVGLYAEVLCIPFVVTNRRNNHQMKVARKIVCYVF